MTSKYNNFNVENPIEVSFDQGDPVVLNKKKGGKATKSPSKRSVGRRSPSPKGDSGEEVQKSGSNNFNFSRMKGQNVTGFTHDSVETGLVSKNQSSLAHRKTSMLPDI